MQVFKFNVGGRSVDRAIADAIGRGIADRIAPRRDADGVPQRLVDLVSRLDERHRDRSHDVARLKSRKPTQD